MIRSVVLVDMPSVRSSVLKFSMPLDLMLDSLSMDGADLEGLLTDPASALLRLDTLCIIPKSTAWLIGSGFQATYRSN